MQTTISDGGASSAGFNETRDCTVRAYAHLCGDYSRAHAVLSAYGRKQRHRFKLKPVAVAIGHDLGLNLIQVKRSGTVARLLADYPMGNLLVLVRGHAFAVIDGIIYDTIPNKPRAIVRGAWLLNNILHSDRKQTTD